MENAYDLAKEQLFYGISHYWVSNKTYGYADFLDLGELLVPFIHETYEIKDIDWESVLEAEMIDEGFAGLFRIMEIILGNYKVKLHDFVDNPALLVSYMVIDNLFYLIDELRNEMTYQKKVRANQSKEEWMDILEKQF